MLHGTPKKFPKISKNFSRVNKIQLTRINWKIKYILSGLVTRRLYFLKKSATFWAKFPSWGTWPICSVLVMKKLGQTRHRAGQDCQGAPNVESDQYRRLMQHITLLVGNVSEEFCTEQSPHLGVGKNAQLTRPHDPRPSRGNTASTLSIWLEYRKDITLGRLSGANGVDTVHAVESWHQACWRLHTTTADYHMYSISLIKSMMVDFQEMHQHTCVCVCLCSCVSLSLCICVIVFVRVCHCLFPGG